MKIITLDYKDFSEEAFNEFKEALKNHNLYLGDIIEDYYGANDSDTYVLYINHRRLTREEIREIYPLK